MNRKRNSSGSIFKKTTFIYWSPRILSIFFLLFLSLFSLDVITPGISFPEMLIGLFMHNIPVLFLLIVVCIAWKHEIFGGIAFFLAGIAHLSLMIINIITHPFMGYMISSLCIIAGPAFLIGVLFFLAWDQKRHQSGRPR